MLNVVDPSPTPNVVPTAVNRAEYVERLMARPSAIVQPAGIDAAGTAVHLISPISAEAGATGSCAQHDTLIPAGPTVIGAGLSGSTTTPIVGE
jgi:hypothetical protein